MTDECVFCKIVKGEVPAQVVAESERTLAFRDINPQAPTHILVIPKEHVEDLGELARMGVLDEIFDVIERVAGLEGLDSYRIVLNKGREAGQAVKHLHFHVLGGRSMGWPPG